MAIEMEYSFSEDYFHSVDQLSNSELQDITLKLVIDLVSQLKQMDKKMKVYSEGIETIANLAKDASVFDDFKEPYAEALEEIKGKIEEIDNEEPEPDEEFDILLEGIEERTEYREQVAMGIEALKKEQAGIELTAEEKVTLRWFELNVLYTKINDFEYTPRTRKPKED